MELENLRELLIDELKDLYHAEGQILKALPKMAKKAKSPALKEAFQSHLRETEGHVQRLQQVFESLGEKAKGKKCDAMAGIIEEGKGLMEEDMQPDVMDAALIAAGQKVEHYEIASYGTVRAWAKLIGENDAVRLLQQTLDEEGLADKKLTKLATEINIEAAS